MTHNQIPNDQNKDDDFWEHLLDHIDSVEENGSVSSVDEPAEPNPAELALWEEAREAMANEIVFELTSLGCNKGGLLLSWQGLPGFAPASQLNDFPNVHIEADRIEELQRRKHNMLKVRIIEVNPQKRNLIFSERAAMVEAETRQSLWDTISPGDKREGTVTNMTDFGAFVDLGGIEGLMHISELSWSRLNHPSDVVQSGQDVKAVVLEVDRVNGRVALSLKRMKPDPWLGIEQRYQLDQIVEGIVSNVLHYGAFITLEDELEGLVHVSEFEELEDKTPQDILSKGDTIRVRVISVSGTDRRIALSLRDLPA